MRKSPSTTRLLGPLLRLRHVDGGNPQGQCATGGWGHRYALGKARRTDRQGAPAGGMPRTLGECDLFERSLTNDVLYQLSYCGFPHDFSDLGRNTAKTKSVGYA